MPAHIILADINERNGSGLGLPHEMLPSDDIVTESSAIEYDILGPS